MPLVTLRDLYVTELGDLHDGEQQVLRELPLMSARSTSHALRENLDEHYRQTHLHIERLDLLFQQLDERPRSNVCAPLRALIDTARARNANTERGEVLDAALIAAAQRIQHFKIAAYGCARTYAATLGDAEAARILQQSLDEEGDHDLALSRLAEHGINQAAGEDLVNNPTRYRSRLRYIATDDLPQFSGHEWHVRSHADERFGSVDGFIVESRSGRPLYFVVDSGGWFAGRRYVVPVGQLEAGNEASVLHTDLSRDTLARYPEFSPSAFLAMSDDEASRYEQRLLLAMTSPSTGLQQPRRLLPGYDGLPVYAPPTWLTGLWPAERAGDDTAPPPGPPDPTR